MCLRLCPRKYISAKKQRQFRLHNSLLVSELKERGSMRPVKPDYEIKLVEEEEDDPPRIFRLVKRTSSNSGGRRRFLKEMAGAIGITAIAGILSECDSELDIVADDEKCKCHVVCTCDGEGKGIAGYQITDASKFAASWESKKTREMSGVVCVCDTVCTCDTVCVCNTVCTCDSVCTTHSTTPSCSCLKYEGGGSSGGGSGGGGGGGGGFWIHYWYPN